MNLSGISATQVVVPSRLLIPSGQVLIGADRPGEGPAREIYVEAFVLERFTVTNRLFGEFVENKGYHQQDLWDRDGLEWVALHKPMKPAFWDDERFNALDQPVTGVSFYEACAYAKWVGGRLPTEIEWEKAARGDDGRPYPWGQMEPELTHANFAPGFVPANRSPLPVYDCPSGDSPYGCRQMVGNVYEWCIDFFHFDTPTRRSQDHLVEVRSSGRRVLKGGAWTTGADRLHASARWSYTPDLRDNIIGFRVAYDSISGSGHV